ncbi:MAG: hypothetical protein R2706_18130 [Acidimicrobiales bacterium]
MVEGGVVLMSLQNRQLVVSVGVANRNSHQKAIELAFRQRIGAFLLDRFLGGDDHERLGELVCLAIDGDLSLGHGFEQGRLGLGRGPVYFIGENQTRKHGAGRNSNVESLRFQMLIPVTSAGRRSGVNWIRPSLAPSELLRAFATVVLPTPAHPQ